MLSSYAHPTVAFLAPELYFKAYSLQCLSPFAIQAHAVLNSPGKLIWLCCQRCRGPGWSWKRCLRMEGAKPKQVEEKVGNGHKRKWEALKR